MAFTVVYDACVLHPAPLRDLLVRLAATDLFRARWSNHILDEMVASVLRRRPDLTSTQLERTRQLMCDAVRDCIVTGYEPLIATIDLPDPDDRHVVAAALRCGAQVIVTNNINDFPRAALASYGLEAQTADEFVLNVIDLAPIQVAEVVRKQAAALRNPPQRLDDLLETLTVNGLHRSVAEIRLRGLQ